MFIVIEGLDGSGKTLVSNTLYDLLVEKGVDVVSTREPYIYRDILLNKGKMDKYTELFLYMAARAQHICDIIRPAISKGQIIICDRFIYSTYAYQGYIRGISSAKIKILNDMICENIQPDYVFILDIDKKTFNKRRTESSYDRIESDILDYFDEIRKYYLSLPKITKNCILIDGTEQIEIIIGEIIKCIPI